MKVEKSFTINGVVVEEVFKKGNTIVYQAKDYDDETTLYFVNKQTSKVEFKLEVNADCNQNVGFISELEFTDVGDV